ADWQVAQGMVAELVTQRARYADLAILAQADPDAPRSGSAGSLVETVLFGAGRPVLIVPYAGHFDTVGQSVLVAWTPTREAPRAVKDALPFLGGAERVTVLSVPSRRRLRHGVAEVDAEIARHLARHGVNAEAAATVVEDIDVGDAILSRAADLGS